MISLSTLWCLGKKLQSILKWLPYSVIEFDVLLNDFSESERFNISTSLLQKSFSADKLFSTTAEETKI